MKIKRDFITNSSSSSFIIIIGDNGHTFPNFPERLVVDGNFGWTEFGWEQGTHDDVGSKIIFSYLQALDVKNEEWMEMLESVIKNFSGAKEIEWNVTTKYNDEEKEWAYIDHQSASIEGRNTEMFESCETLKDFLFGNGSHIVTDNDNH